MTFTRPTAKLLLAGICAVPGFWGVATADDAGPVATIGNQATNQPFEAAAPQIKEYLDKLTYERAHHRGLREHRGVVGSHCR